MTHTQADLFAQEDGGRNKLSEPQRLIIQSRLEATIAQLEAAATFPWGDPLDAVHEEKRFQRDSEMLGDKGAALWARFDEEMNRLFSTQSTSDAEAA